MNLDQELWAIAARFGVCYDTNAGDNSDPSFDASSLSMSAIEPVFNDSPDSPGSTPGSGDRDAGERAPLLATGSDAASPVYIASAL